MYAFKNPYKPALIFAVYFKTTIVRRNNSAMIFQDLPKWKKSWAVLEIRILWKLGQGCTLRKGR
jgi:hypothetical protein